MNTKISGSMMKSWVFFQVRYFWYVLTVVWTSICYSVPCPKSEREFLYVCMFAFFVNKTSPQAWFACQRYIWVGRWGFGSHTFSHDFLTELLVVDFRWPCSFSHPSPPTSCNENAEENGIGLSYSWRQCCRTLFMGRCILVSSLGCSHKLFFSSYSDHRSCSAVLQVRWNCRFQKCFPRFTPFDQKSWKWKKQKFTIPHRKQSRRAFELVLTLLTCG